MKATDKAQKTENRKFEKPVSKTLAVVLSLVLISLTVNANGFWKQLLVNNTFGKMAILMVDQENMNEKLMAYTSLAPEANSSEAMSLSNDLSFEPVKDKNLEIENWMTNGTNFTTNAFTEQISYEEPLKIENWMIEDSCFAVSFIEDDYESALEVEGWMTNESVWKN